MHCNVKTRCEALKALAQKKLGTDDPAVVEITRGGKNRSHHVLRRSDMKKVGLIAGGAFVALTALNVYSHYKLHQKIADRKLKKQLAPLNAQLDELRTENEALRQALAELKPRPAAARARPGSRGLRAAGLNPEKPGPCIAGSGLFLCFIRSARGYMRPRRRRLRCPAGASGSGWKGW